MNVPKLEDFPVVSFDKLRFGDTDRQGHINNAVFVTALETGRVSMLHAKGAPRPPPDVNFVIVRLVLDFRAELFWPGTVDIGTGIMAVGRSSLTFRQALFQSGKCVATSESVTVQVGAGKPVPLADEARTWLAGMLMA